MSNEKYTHAVQFYVLGRMVIGPHEYTFRWTCFSHDVFSSDNVSLSAKFSS